MKRAREDLAAARAEANELAREAIERAKKIVKMLEEREKVESNPK